MKKAIWILSIALIISISIIVLMLIFHKRYITKLTKENDIIIQNKDKLFKDRQDTIDDLYKNPLTKETIKYLSSEKKDKIILDQQEIIKGDTVIINDLYDRLNKTNEALKTASFSFQHSLSLFALAGIDKTLTPDIYVGLMYRRYFPKFVVIQPFIGAGVAVKIYENVGGAALFEVGFKFGKKKI